MNYCFNLRFQKITFGEKKKTEGVFLATPDVVFPQGFFRREQDQLPTAYTSIPDEIS